MKLYAGILLIFFVVLSGPVLWAQPPQISVRLINYDDGLSNSTIECISQDSRGFIWIGTRDGLNKYDGYHMTVYRNRKGDHSSLSDNYVKYIYEDSQKELWIGTTSGLNRFDPKSQLFKSYMHRPHDPLSISGNYITCVMEDSRHQLWVSTADGGLNLFNRKTGTARHFRSTSDVHTLSSDTVNYITEDKSGTIWVATAKGLNRYNRQNGRFTRYFSHGFNALKQVKEDNSGKLWIATEGSGLIVFDPLSNTFRNFRHSDTSKGSLGNDLVLCLLIARNGQLWAGTINGGLNLFNSRSADFTRYSNEPGNPSVLSQRTISALFEDKQGNIWIGTHRGGVNLYTPAARKFSVYREESRPNSLSYNDVKCFAEDHSGRIWIGTDGGGLNLFNPVTQTFRAYRHKSSDPQSLGSDAVLNINEDSHHRLWVATWGGGLDLMNASAGSFKHFRNIVGDTSSLSSDFVQNIFEDSKGKLWVGTYFGGLNLLDPSSGRFRRIKTSWNGQTRLTGNNVIALSEDRQGNLWIGTDDGGLNCLNRRTGQFEHYFDTQNKKLDIRIIFSDSKGRLWVGHEGLYLFNPINKTFKLFTLRSGLGSIFIKGIEEDSRGNLWISTSAGVVRLNPRTRQTRSYNTSDGLQAMEFEAGAVMKTRAGQIFFGGVNGFNAFYPEKMKNNPWIPPVYITGFQIFNRDIRAGDKTGILKKEVTYTRLIHLTYRQSSISFTFAALNYLAAVNNRYAYKLNGFDKDWNYTGGHRATYTNLDPGTYQFRVIASNNDGLWNKEGASLTIIISPPWWQTWWFRLLLATAALGSAYAIHIHRKNLHIKKLNEEKKEELHQMQLQFFTNISHEFRTPLTLISGPIEKLMNTEKRPFVLHAYSQVLRNTQRLMNLVNELMDFRKVESGILKLRVAPGNMNVFLEEITSEFQDWAGQKKIDFRVENNPQPLPEVFFDRQILEKILLNLINNSFKYTEDGGSIFLRLFFTPEQFHPTYSNELKVINPWQAEEYMYILVADTGIGISSDSIGHLFQRYYRITSSHLGSGIGLAFVKTLVTLHKGNIFVYSERNRGTEFLLALPYKASDYTSEELQKDDRSNLMLESLHSEWDTTPPLPTDQSENPPVVLAAGAQKILLTEDNRELRHFLKESLENQYFIIEAPNGQQGLDLALKYTPDLIISDVMMPRMDGIEFCRRVKNDEQLKGIPFIMLTAKDTLEARIEGVGSGADFYFSKPISMNLLLLTIRNIFTHENRIREQNIHDYESEIKTGIESERDRQFISRLLALVEAQIVNPDLDVEYLCNQLNMGRTRLYETVRRITGQSIVEFVRAVRLNKAKEMMVHQDLQLSEIMFRVGIQTQSYFTKAFKREFGKTPTQFLKDLKKG